MLCAHSLTNEIDYQVKLQECDLKKKFVIKKVNNDEMKYHTFQPPDTDNYVCKHTDNTLKALSNCDTSEFMLTYDLSLDLLRKSHV